VTEISCREANWVEVAQVRPCVLLRDDSNGLSETELPPIFWLYDDLHLKE